MRPNAGRASASPIRMGDSYSRPRPQAPVPSNILKTMFFLFMVASVATIVGACPPNRQRPGGMAPAQQHFLAVVFES